MFGKWQSFYVFFLFNGNQVNSDSNGLLDKQELYTCLKELNAGKNVTQEELEDDLAAALKEDEAGATKHF